MEYIPAEEMIRLKQQDYYDALGASDMEGTSTKFIEYSLVVILDSLKLHMPEASKPKDSLSRLEVARTKIQLMWFTRKNICLYTQIFPQAPLAEI